MHEYYDSSAFTKLFLQESGTDAMRLRYIAATSRTVSRLAFVEVTSAIKRLERDGKITLADSAKAAGKLAAETQHAQIIPVSEDVLTLAQDILARHDLKTLDAIQLACAVVAARTNPMLFVACDKRLLRAATAEGFPITDLKQP